jgi:hypothetical protein
MLRSVAAFTPWCGDDFAAIMRRVNQRLSFRHPESKHTRPARIGRGVAGALVSSNLCEMKMIPNYLLWQTCAGFQALRSLVGGSLKSAHP